MKAIKIGDQLVVHFNNKMYSKSFDINQREKIYQFLLNADEKNEDDILKFKNFFRKELSEEELKNKQKIERQIEESKKFSDILDLMQDIKNNSHELLEVKENSIYLKGINISMPELLVKEIIKAYDSDNNERLKALINFWYLCAMNPDPRARHDLFKFLSNHNLNLTPSGNFIAYRNVNVKKRGNEKLEKFITQEWLKIKRWKKSPKNYMVFEEENINNYFISKTNNKNEKLIGNLDELYQNIGDISGNIYTDNYTKTFEIKIGEPVKMSREKVDPDNTNSCSNGLHCGNISFMKANMGFFGNIGIVVLINPKNVTSVPIYDNGKMRTCEYLPIALAELDDNNNIIDVDIDVFDLEMVENTKEELDFIKNISNKEFEELKKNEFYPIDIDINSLQFIKDQTNINLKEASKIINKRLIKI